MHALDFIIKLWDALYVSLHYLCITHVVLGTNTLWLAKLASLCVLKLRI